MHVPSKIVCVGYLRFSKEMEIFITTVFWCIKNISGSLLFYNPSWIEASTDGVFNITNLIIPSNIHS